VEADVYIWSYALLVVDARKEEKDPSICNCSDLNSKHITQNHIYRLALNNAIPIPSTALLAGSEYNYYY